MPAGDGTGPQGMGPMTGRAMGRCAGYAAPGWANPGRGGRRGAYAFGGGGRGWRNWYYATGLPRWARGPWPFVQGAPLAPPTREREIEMLKQQADLVTGQLDAINKRMSELSTE